LFVLSRALLDPHSACAEGPKPARRARAAASIA
jgi:hypothetical protein